MVGLLDLEGNDFNNALGMGLLGAAQGIQQARPGSSILGAFGSGAGGFGQGLNAFQQNQAMDNLRKLQAMQAQAQIQKLKTEAEQSARWQQMFSPTANPTQQAGDTSQPSAPMMGLPPELMPYIAMMGPEKGSSFLANAAAKKAGIGDNSPSAIQEYEYYSKLSPEEQARYLSVKRANQWLNLGGTMALPNQAVPGQMQAEIPKTLAPEDTPVVRGQQAQAAAGGRVTGEQTAQAQMGLPQAIAQTEQQIKLIEDLVKAPGFSDVVGAPGSISGAMNMMTGRPIPGTDAANFVARLDQIGGQQFLQAYETLKGSGQITEIEGKKATEAMSRLTKTNQTEAEYKKAADELISVLKSGMNRAKMKAGISAPAQVQSAPSLPDPLGLR